MENLNKYAEEINLLDYLNVIRKRKKIILVIFLSAIIWAVALSLKQPKIYEATALILVSPSRAYNINPEASQFYLDIVKDGRIGDSINRRSSIALPTHKMLLKSNTVMERIIKRLNQTGGLPQFMAPEDLINKLSIKEEDQTSIFCLSAQDSDPNVAMNLANAWAQEYIQYSQEFLLGERKGVDDFFVNQFEIVKRNLVQDEEKVAEFQNHFKIDLMQADLDIKKRKLNSYKEDRMNTEKNIKTQGHLLEELKKEIAGQEQFIVTSKAITDDVLWQESSKTQGPNNFDTRKLSSQSVNPIYQYLRRQIIDTETSLNVNKPEVEYLEQSIISTEKEINDLEKIINEKQIQLNQLTREVGITKQIYDNLSAKTEETRINKAAQLGEIKLASSAYKPQHPIGSDKRGIVIQAAFLGATVGIVVAFLMEALATAKSTKSK